MHAHMRTPAYTHTARLHAVWDYAYQPEAHNAEQAFDRQSSPAQETAASVHAAHAMQTKGHM
eukprot:162307-Pelagomonas_calceolata.AAC.2